METTVPSIVSTTGVARSGSSSCTVKVPSEFSSASILATWLFATHDEAFPGVGDLQSVPLGSVSSAVEVFTVPFNDPRPTFPLEAIVTLDPETATTPVKSSIRSSCPVARFEFARGSAKARTTLRLVFVVELVRLSVRAPAFTDSALARLKSIPNPVFPFTDSDCVMTGVPVPDNAALQTVFAKHCGLKLVIVAPVPLKKATSAFARDTVMLLIPPVSTFVSVPRNAESDCARTRSTVTPLPPFIVSVVFVPVVEVRVTELTVMRKLINPRLEGTVSATSTKLTLFVPFPLVPCGTPLQDVRAKEAAKPRERKGLLSFMSYPTAAGLDPGHALEGLLPPFESNATRPRGAS